MANRRAFLGGLTSAGVGVATAMFRPDAIARAYGAGKTAGQTSPDQLAREEDYWSEIQRCFDTDRTLINLNNGGVCPTPSHVLEGMIRDLRFCNEAPVHHMWRILEPRVESVRRELAREFGCDPEEIAITRNASEAMENLILGIDLKKGDEVVVTEYNYNRMLTTWDQRARREGIVVKKLKYPVPMTNPRDLIDKIEAAITPRTKVIELPHVSNWTGQILPIREICRLGSRKGIDVFVDGAHAFAHFPFKRDDLECDYYGTSLHKWLLAPIGTGFLYVRKSKIKKIWPLMAAGEGSDENIRKFEEIGTHPAANHNAINAALVFHRGIGGERKAARLRYLRDRWAKPLREASPRVKINTPIDDDSLSGAIALVRIEGIDTGKLNAFLSEKYMITATTSVFPDFQGVRITPNVYTTLEEIDVLSEGLHRALQKGV